MQRRPFPLQIFLKEQQRLRGLAFSPPSSEGRFLVALASEKNNSFSLFPTSPSDGVLAMKLHVFPLGKAAGSF